MEKADKIKLVKDSVTSYPNFPKPGIMFRDIFGIFKNVAAMQAMRDLLLEHIALLDIDFIVGLDSRGFLLGPLFSFELAKPFVPIRKKGKLPGKVRQQNFTLEYGEDTFEIQSDILEEKTKALIIDDLLATGGSMSTAVKLLKSSGVIVVECVVIIELNALHGRSKIEAPVYSLLQYD